MKKFFNIIKSFYPKGKVDQFLFPLFILSALFLLFYNVFYMKDNNKDITSYENVNTIILKDPNLSKNKIDELDKLNLFKSKGQSGYIEDSNYVPIKKYLSANKLQFLKNITNYYTFQKLSNDSSNDFFKYNLNSINITNLDSIQTNLKNYNVSMNVSSTIFGSEYIINNQMGDYNISAIITNTDTKNVLSRSILEKNQISFICQKMFRQNKNIILRDCGTDAEYANEYLFITMSNLNNNPSIVSNDTKNFYYYMILSAYFLDPDSICSKNNSIYYSEENMQACNIDLKASRDKINGLTMTDRDNYLKYTYKISKSLKINLPSLSANSGFEVLDYKYLAEKMLENKYLVYENWQKKYLWGEINRIYDPKNPQNVLNMELYDDYKLRNINEVEKKLNAIKDQKNKYNKTNSLGE